MSRYDYRDPGQDPAYCDGLSDPPESYTCGWCGVSYLDRAEYPYCSTQCALEAERDDRESDADHACQALTAAIADLWSAAQRVPPGPRLLALWASVRTLEQAMTHITNAVAARVDGGDRDV